jgi:Outer membrane protein beta-barrel domain
MSKKSFNDIEGIIKHSMEANEPAFNEASWKKMEALLDKEEDRRRPFIFWLWILIPMLIVSGGLAYYAYNKSYRTTIDPQILANRETHNGTAETRVRVDRQNGSSNKIPVTGPAENSSKSSGTELIPAVSNTLPGQKSNSNDPVGSVGHRRITVPVSKSMANNTANGETASSNNKLAGGTGSKTKVSITPAAASEDNVVKDKKELASPAAMAGKVTAPGAEEELLVVKIESVQQHPNGEKEIVKIIDSVIEKSVTNKKDKHKISRIFVIVAAGAEGSGTRLFSVDRITSRVGLAAGYNINSRLSVQAGFFMSNKKYKADGSSYKAKPGTYWSIVDIKEIDARCRVYEIPLQVNYNFTPGKKLNISGSAGLSSYIMKKEDYQISYNRYGTPHKADVYYSGNKNLFSVLRISAGVEKKLGNQFSAFAAPGVAIPLAGVGEGEVRLYSAEVIFGLKFTPSRKNK